MGENLRRKDAGLVALTVGAVLGVRFGEIALLAVFDLTPKYWGAAQSEAPGLAVTLGQLFVSAALGPCTEEIFFRGLIFRRLLRHARPLPAALCSSVLFGLVHFDLVGATLFGLAMVVLYVQTRSLWVPIAAHVLNNLLIGLSTRFGVHVSASWTVMAISIASLPWLAWFLRRGLRQVQSLPQSSAG
jgi:membrane protease YdiL (CAAX protease family)